jgi:hypothetical protein
MRAHRLPLAVGMAPLLLFAGLLAGCGGVAASNARVAEPTVTRSQAVAYAAAVNLRPGDLTGFSGLGGEVEVPAPGPDALEYARCTGVANPADRVAAIASPEFSAGRAFDSRLIKSSVEVWPTAATVTLDKARSESAHGRACLVRDIKAIHTKINRERKGQMQIGQFTIRSMPNPLPGAADGSQTRLDETRLHRNGEVFFHVYRDLLGFTSGPAEVELEAVGFVHPVPSRTEKQALRILLERATANTGDLRPQTSP